MLFNSYEFIFLFLPFTFFVYFYIHSLRKEEAAKIFLVAASLFFYGWWNPSYLPLIILSMVVNFSIGRRLASFDKKCRFGAKKLLIAGIFFNLLLLGYYKYSDFFIENINTILPTHFALLHLALPLAISFFTFQQIAYLVDSYRLETKEYSFLNYALFVTFFPQLIAGPIVHHAEMMPQFSKKNNMLKHYGNIALGLFVFSMGLFKKVVLADSFALLASKGFDATQALNMTEAWIASLSYTLQLYFDFSGYTDMAIGAALLFNIRLPMNFFSPYKAVNIQDFWRRWHITLSRFLRDYLYIPLGGNRHGSVRTYLNLFVTFLLGGLWHGAAWTFVIWGALHGIAMVIHRIWKEMGFRMPSFLGWFITFNFINMTWVFFRAHSFEDALRVLKGMFFGLPTLSISLAPIFGFLKDFGVAFGHQWSQLYGHDGWVGYGIIIGFMIVFFAKNSMELKERFVPNWFYLIWTVIGFSAIFIMYRKSEFIYFNF